MTRPVFPDGDASDAPSPGDTPSSDASSSDTFASDMPVRRGSPFAKSSHRADGGPAIDARALSSVEPAFDPEWGVLRAANWASAWVALCALACLQMFPAGGVIVAALGCALATIGLFSSRVLVAGGLLALHAWLFFACYQKLF